MIVAQDEKTSQAAARAIKKIGQFIIDRADYWASDMDENPVSQDGLTILVKVNPNGNVDECELRKGYIVIGDAEPDNG